jgi:membrane protein DedA with SNARE-associated domain
MDAVQPFVAWLVEHTYPVVLVATMIDATAVPFPGRLLLAAAGAFAAAGRANAVVIVALGSLGAMAVDHLWYFGGALGAARLQRLYCRSSVGRSRCAARTEDWFRRFGVLTIVVGRFFAVVRLFAWPLARARGVGYPTFLAFDALGAVLWTTLWVGLGWLLGSQWDQAADRLGWMLPAAFLALAAVIGVRMWWRARAA